MNFIKSASLAAALVFAPLTYSLAASDSIGWRHANGITVLCPGAANGAVFELEGKTYRVVYSKADAKTYAAHACTLNMTDMSHINFGPTFNEDLSHWDTSKVTTMYRMFYGAKGFDQDLSGWCVSGISSKPSDFDYYTPFWQKENRQPI